jgi:release factor glutamine methyltransferase
MSDSPPVTIRQALQRAVTDLSGNGNDYADLEARLLLSHTLGCENDLFFREPERELDGDTLKRFLAAVARRATGEPLQHITGTQEFWSITFRADPRALIPRPETEHLVEAALDRLPQDSTAAVLDLCTGSGIVAAVLARQRPGISVSATDISDDALALAAENLEALGLEDRVSLLRGDLFAPLGRPRPMFEVITANPPYIGREELAGLATEVRDHEPLAALDGGEDGLDLVRRILGEAGPWLVPGGLLLMEIGAGQWGTVEKIAREAGCWGDPGWVRDLNGYRRVLRLPG